jgi:hypothetical protein
MRTITQRNAFTERLAAALRGELQPQNNAVPTKPHEPLGEILRRSAKHLVVGRPGTSAPLPRQAYGTPRDVAPSHGPKKRDVHYVEDFTVDNSGWSEVQDLAAAGLRYAKDRKGRTLAVDVLDAQMLSSSGRDERRIEDARHSNRDPWAKCKIFCAQAEAIATTAGEDETLAPSKPQTPRRELLQRTSKRQRLIMKAFRLQQSGTPWDATAKQLGIRRAEAREIQRLITSMLGRAIVKSGVVGSPATSQNSRKPSKSAVIRRIAA